MRRLQHHNCRSGRADVQCPVPRVGEATVDYVLALGVVFPLLVVILPMGRRAMQLVYEMTTTLVAWPFM